MFFRDPLLYDAGRSGSVYTVTEARRKTSGRTGDPALFFVCFKAADSTGSAGRASGGQSEESGARPGYDFLFFHRPGTYTKVEQSHGVIRKGGKEYGYCYKRYLRNMCMGA